MDVRVKLSILADAAKYDASCASSGSQRAGVSGGLGNTTKVGICHSYTPDGRCVSLLKILLTNYCIYDCTYCVNRLTSDVPRARFSVREVVDLTIEFYRRNYIEGLFLSSGVIQSPDYTMEQMVAVARTLRLERGYNGYIHLKAVPGASAELLRRACLYADRLSANIELPTQPDLDQLAPQKDHATIEHAMATLGQTIRAAAEERRRQHERSTRGAIGQSTQMIVGATPTPDATVLQTASRLYRTHRLRRVFYSAFSPIPHGDGRLPPRPPPLVREHRLYQADWLMRFYGFGAAELTTDARPNLELEIDPKLAWALRHREAFPVDLNRAPRHRLLRVPGLGVRNVDRIISARRFTAIRMIDLRKLRVAMRKIRPWVIVADYNPELQRLDRLDLRGHVAHPNAQLELFDAHASANSGEV
jgi:putative DNA modification/repair radical SAM protein